MSNSLRAQGAKDLIETVISPDFSRYSYQGQLVNEETEESIPNTSVHMVYTGDKSFIVTYDGNTGTLGVYCVNIQANVLSACYNEDKASWTFEGVFDEDTYGSNIIHACRVMKSLHDISQENN